MKTQQLFSIALFLLAFVLGASAPALAQKKAQMPKLPGTTWVSTDIRLVDASGELRTDLSEDEVNILEGIRQMMLDEPLYITFTKKGVCTLAQGKDDKGTKGAYTVKGNQVEIDENLNSAKEPDVAQYDASIPGLVIKLEDTPDGGAMEVVFTKK